MEVAGSGIEQPESQRLLQVRLRTPLAEYFGLRLLEKYNFEQKSTQQSGTPQELQEFNTSSFARLVNKFSNACRLEKPAEKVSTDKGSKTVVFIDLTEIEVNLAISKMAAIDPNNLVGFKTQAEMIKELKENFQSANTKAKIKEIIGKITSFFGTKKTS